MLAIYTSYTVYPNTQFIYLAILEKILFDKMFASICFPFFIVFPPIHRHSLFLIITRLNDRKIKNIV